MFKTGAKENNSSRSLSHFFYLHCMIESSDPIWNSAMGIGECWKFAMTDRSLLYTVVKASHTLIQKRKLVLPRRATYC